MEMNILPTLLTIKDDNINERPVAILDLICHLLLNEEIIPACVDMGIIPYLGFWLNKTKVDEEETKTASDRICECFTIISVKTTNIQYKCVRSLKRD